MCQGVTSNITRERTMSRDTKKVVRRRRLSLPRVLVLDRGQAKAPYAAIELHLGGGKVAVYTLAGQHKAVR